MSNVGSTTCQGRHEGRVGKEGCLSLSIGLWRSEWGCNDLGAYLLHHKWQWCSGDSS